MGDQNLKVVLEGTTGSRAYGLDTPESDVDVRGVYVAPTKAILGLCSPAEVIDRRDPDVTFYEVGKFIRLALKCNPNIIEMLWLEQYLRETWEGQLLVEHREDFLSDLVVETYAGYALSQAHKLNNRHYSALGPHRRHDKHARHCFRLLQQGRELLETGNLTVRVSNREELFAIGQLPVDELLERFEQEFRAFKQVQSCLPSRPNAKEINRLLLEIRYGNF